MEIYYKQEENRVSKIVIADELPDSVKEIQRNLAKSAGMLPVTGYTDIPSPPSMFGLYKEAFTPVKDGDAVVSYAHGWKFTPFAVRLSQSKILSDKAIVPNLEQFATAVSSDETLKAWWTSSTVYVRGSDLAAKLMETFGFTQDELEDIVKRCRDNIPPARPQTAEHRRPAPVRKRPQKKAK